MGQLLHHAFQPPTPEGDLDRFMATVFIDAIRDCLKTGGWAAKNSEQEEGGEFLVGIHGRLFKICSDYQVAEAADRYDASGCGDQAARGALFATAGLAMKPRARMQVALKSAERFSGGVRRPFVIVATDKA